VPCPVNCAGDQLPCLGYASEWGPKEEIIFSVPIQKNIQGRAG
jgi:hypothetical protein